jgi:hypothetical protein
MGGSDKSIIGIELEVAIMVPLLQSKSQTLVVEKFRIKLINSLGRNEDDLEVVGTLGLRRARDTLRLPIGDCADLEKKDVVWEAKLVVGKGGGQGVFNSLFV